MNLFEILKAIFSLFLERKATSRKGVEEEEEYAEERQPPSAPPIFDEDVFKAPPVIPSRPPSAPTLPKPQPSPIIAEWKFKIPIGSPVPYIVRNNIIIGNLKEGNPQLSPNFQANEFTCPCCKEYRIAIPVLEGLQAARVLVGKPLYVAKTTLGSSINPAGSGYRCPKHNSRVKGASATSLHMQGQAIDISCPSISVDRLVQYLEQIPVFRNGGIGVYATFVHVDNGRKRRWTA